MMNDSNRRRDFKIPIPVPRHPIIIVPIQIRPPIGRSRWGPGPVHPPWSLPWNPRSNERPEWFEEPERFERHERFEEPQRFERHERFEEPQRFERHERFEEPQRFDRPIRTGRLPWGSSSYPPS